MDSRYNTHHKDLMRTGTSFLLTLAFLFVFVAAFAGATAVLHRVEETMSSVSSRVLAVQIPVGDGGEEEVKQPVPTGMPGVGGDGGNGDVVDPIMEEVVVSLPEEVNVPLPESEVIPIPSEKREESTVSPSGTIPRVRVPSDRLLVQQPRPKEDPLLVCLEGVVGKERFSVILDGQSTPTPDEVSKGYSCFDGEAARFAFTTGPLPNDVDACVRSSLGKEGYEAVVSGEKVIETPEGLQRVRECFGVIDTPFAPPPIVTVPEEVTVCLEEKIGVERSAQIMRGEWEPTSRERDNAATCIQLIALEQRALLPLPPDLVTFLSKSAATVSVTGAVTVDESITAFTTVPRVVILGRAAPKAIVDLYLFSSSPVVVTLATDENGVWRYTLDQPISEGVHRAYAIVKVANHGVVRSPVFPFGIARAEAAGLRESGLVVQSAVPSYTRWYFLGSGVILSVGVFALLLFFVVRRRSRPASREEG